MKTLFLFVIIMVSTINLSAQRNSRVVDEDVMMPYGHSFDTWGDKTTYTKTYIVDKNHPMANDGNPGSIDLPFATIGKAASVLSPGERVFIRSGVYREMVVPRQGGLSSEMMVAYQAYPGEHVVVKGSVEVEAACWEPSNGWQTRPSKWYDERKDDQSVSVWQCNLGQFDLDGYNPFGLLNLMQDQEWLDYKKVNMDPHFKKRGLVFVDGVCLKQVRRPIDLQQHQDGAFWAEHNGLTLHVRFPDGKTPSNSQVEITTKEQLFAPQQYGLGFIKVKGIHFMHVGNGFPVPQRGALSARRGHHWIVEDCVFDWANSVGVDLGNEMWHTTYPPQVGYHIFRRNVVSNCGIAGLQGLKGVNYLIEDNLFENIGWQDAEHGFESGAIKLHMSKNTLIRRNVFRNIVHAPGIWLDYNASENCRITKNVFAGITSARGAVYVEVSRERCRIDHNLFFNIRAQYWISGDYGAGGNALYTDGSDSISFDRNLIYDAENCGYGSYANASRIVNGRGGTERNQRVERNIFIKCGKHAIEFPNEHNFSDSNIFSDMPAAFLKVKYPEPSLLLDLKAWQDCFGWEKSGKVIQVVDVAFDMPNLRLTLKMPHDFNLMDVGPFKDYSGILDVDPRKLVAQ